jgi:uncharacterized protein (DUF58 family)
MKDASTLVQLHSFNLKGAYPALDDLLALKKATHQLTLDTVIRHTPAAGNWQTRIRGRGLDFAEVRQYQPGDDIRSIDWRVTAKTQKTHTRLFTQEKERPIILAADIRSDMFFGSVNCFKSVVCAGVISMLAWIALKSKDRVGGVIIGDQKHIELRAKASRSNVLSFIHTLQTYCEQLTSPIASDAKQTLDQMFITLMRTAKPGSAVYIASDFHDIDQVNIGRILKLTQHCRLTFIVISDPLEWQLPNRRHLQVTDGINQSELLDTQHHFMQQRMNKLSAICQRLNIEILNVSTADDLVTLMQNRFNGYAKKHSKRGGHGQ